MFNADFGVQKTLSKVRIGDQVRFSDVLAEYSHNHGSRFKRDQYTVRTDTCNGACETIYVDRIDTLKTGVGPWRWLKWVSIGLLAFGLIAWFRLPIRNNA